MDAQSFLMGSGSPGFSFAVPGTRLICQIVAEPRVQQQKVFSTNELAFWPSGDPKLQLAVDVMTQFRNYEGVANPDPSRPDQGSRTVYIKGKHFEKAVKQAILTAGATFLAIGGLLDITYTGDDMTSKAGIKPKMFAVIYTPPPPSMQAPQMPTQQQFMGQPSPYTPAGYGFAQQQHAQAGPFAGYSQNPTPTPAAQPFPQAFNQLMQNGYAMSPVAQQPPHHENGPMPSWAAAPVSPAPPSPPAAPSPPPAAPMSTLAAIKAAREMSGGEMADGEAPF